MVVSHYSTTYVCLTLLAVTYLLRTVFEKIFAKKLQAFMKTIKIPFTYNLFFKKPRIPGAFVIILVLFTFFWNSLFTKTSGDLLKTLQSTLASIHISFSQDAKSSDVSYSFFFQHVVTHKQFVSEYIHIASLSPK